MTRTPRAAARPTALVIGLLTAAGTGALAVRTYQLEQRVGDDAMARATLLTRLEAERDERASLDARARELSQRADALATALAEARRTMEESREGVSGRLAALERASGDRLGALEQRAESESRDVATLRHRMDTVAPGNYDQLLGPTVKLSSRSDVGSGTVVYSAKHGEKYVSYVVTAFHIVEQNYDPKSPIPLDVITFREGQKVREEKGTVVLAETSLDLALVEIQSEKPYENVARLVPQDRVAGVPLYSRVHAIGCPLGYAPMPTSGELTSKTKALDGQIYWMINAPTIFGNSGGGIFLADTGEMIGVLSRISAYKNLIDVAVPHMGIITSMGDVYDWLDREKYGFIVGHETSAGENLSLAGKKAPAPTEPDRGALVPARAGPAALRGE